MVFGGVFGLCKTCDHIPDLLSNVAQISHLQGEPQGFNRIVFWDLFMLAVAFEVQSMSMEKRSLWMPAERIHGASRGKRRVRYSYFVPWGAHIADIARSACFWCIKTKFGNCTWCTSWVSTVTNNFMGAFLRQLSTADCCREYPVGVVLPVSVALLMLPQWCYSPARLWSFAISVSIKLAKTEVCVGEVRCVRLTTQSG